MSYESAPATLLVATHCAACSKPLVDAVSVETGIGPECRKKHGFMVDVDPEIRARANELVFRIAAKQVGIDVARACEELRVIGFAKLAERIGKRLYTVKLVLVDNGFEVIAPYKEEAVAAMRSIPGRRWVADRKVNFVPHTSIGALHDFLRDHYSGHLALGRKGPFVVC